MTKTIIPSAAEALVTAQVVQDHERARIAIELAAKQRELEAEARPEALAEIVVHDDGSYELVTDFRRQIRATKDELVGLRQAAAQPWKRVATTIEEMFRPAIRAAEAIEADFRTKLEQYQRAKLLAEKAAREAAVAAAQANDSDALVEALNESVALAERPDGGRVAVRWIVKRVVADLLPDEYWCPDTAKIEAVAKAHKGDDPPVIPGVVFEQAVSVAVKR